MKVYLNLYQKKMAHTLVKCDIFFLPGLWKILKNINPRDVHFENAYNVLYML